MDRLHCGIRARLTARTPHDHHRDLLDKGRELFRVESLRERLARCDRGSGNEGFECSGDVGGGRGAQDKVALSVVREMSRLEHEGESKLGAGVEDGCGERVDRGGRRRSGGDGEEGRDWNSLGGEEDFLGVLVLDHADHSGRREDLDTLA